jgi:acyl-CoA synthetase (NDP forming)
MEIIEKAVKKKAGSLSEHESKEVLAAYGVPVTNEFLVKKMKDAVEKAEEIGYPVVLKGSGRELIHKTEMDVIRVGLKSAREVRVAFKEIKEKAGKLIDGILVQEMVKGQRELVIGLIRDAQFGPCVMFGLGGIYTEILRDVSFRVAPLEKRDAMEMMEDIKGKKILEAFRGMAPADRDILAQALIGLGRLGLEHDAVKEVDVNPLILTGEGKPVAVDALVVLEGAKEKAR